MRSLMMKIRGASKRKRVEHLAAHLTTALQHAERRQDAAAYDVVRDVNQSLRHLLNSDDDAVHCAQATLLRCAQTLGWVEKELFAIWLGAELRQGGDAHVDALLSTDTGRGEADQRLITSTALRKCALRMRNAAHAV